MSLVNRHVLVKFMAYPIMHQWVVARLALSLALIFVIFSGLAQVADVVIMPFSDLKLEYISVERLKEFVDTDQEAGEELPADRTRQRFTLTLPPGSLDTLTIEQEEMSGKVRVCRSGGQVLLE